MKKLVIPVAAILALSFGPAWADDSESETRVEQRVEQNGPGLDAEHSRSVETKTEHSDDDDDETTTSVRRDERISAGAGTVEKKTEEHVEHDD